MIRTYAIGDIHGYIDELRRAHRLIAEDRARTGDQDAPVVHLGDLVDRGPDTAGVIDLLSEGIAAAEPWVVLKGNHDRMFAGFMEDPARRDPGLSDRYTWLAPALGGLDTLASYGVGTEGREVAQIQADALHRVPEAHQEFLAGLPTSYRRGDLMFVHAGVRPGVPLDAQAEDDLVWIRSPFLEDTRNHGALIVHGHTALDAATHHGNRVNLDTGAGYGRPITAAVFEGRDAFILTDEGRVPLRPPY